MHNPALSKFGFSRLVEEIAQARDTAGTAPEALDRRTLLTRLAAKLEVEEVVLLRRGFDRAYRRIIEGV